MTRNFNPSDAPLHSLKLAIEGLHIAMLTTTDADGRLSSKPMYLLEHDAQGQFWFFTQSPTDKLDPSEPYRRQPGVQRRGLVALCVRVLCRRDRA